MKEFRWIQRVSSGRCVGWSEYGVKWQEGRTEGMKVLYRLWGGGKVGLSVFRNIGL